MNRFGSVMLIGIAFLGVGLPGLSEQAQSPGLEQQLKSQYPVTRVGANGAVVHAGTVLRVLKDGIRSMPASYAVFWPNNYKNGDKVGYHWSCPKCRYNLMRPLQVGEMVYLTDVETKEADLVFRFQSCGECGAQKSAQTETPYSAEMSFQMGRGYLARGSFKEVQDVIGQVFEIVPPQQPPPPAPSPASSSAQPKDVSAAPSAAVETLLGNQDVIKMVKAGLDDTLIIAKITSSKCQFDTSTDALIQLKESGVSAAVLKVIVGGK